MRTQTTEDHRIAELAARQHGVVARAQLFAIGLTRDAITRRIRAGRLHLMHRGVYAVGHRRLTERGRWMAAVLAGGDGALLTHGSGAALWLLPFSRGRTTVTVPGRKRAPSGITFVESQIPDDERTRIDGIPVTTVPRTLLDLAGITDERRLEKAVNEAEYRGLWDALSIVDLLDRYPRRAGTPALRAILESRSPGVTRSKLEDRFLSFLHAAVLPRPQLNVPIELEPGR